MIIKSSFEDAAFFLKNDVFSKNEQNSLKNEQKMIFRKSFIFKWRFNCQFVNILHSFFVQNASIFSKDFISGKIFGARHWICENSPNVAIFCSFLANRQKFRARRSARAPKIFSKMNSLEKIDAFCTINECKIFITRI